MTRYILMRVYKPGEAAKAWSSLSEDQPIGWLPVFDTLEAVKPWNTEGAEITMMEGEGG